MTHSPAPPHGNGTEPTGTRRACGSRCVTSKPSAHSPPPPMPAPPILSFREHARHGRRLPPRKAQRQPRPASLRACLEAGQGAWRQLGPGRRRHLELDQSMPTPRIFLMTPPCSHRPLDRGCRSSVATLTNICVLSSAHCFPEFSHLQECTQNISQVVELVEMANRIEH